MPPYSVVSIPGHHQRAVWEPAEAGAKDPGKTYVWDGRAETLCGKTFKHGKFREPFFYGGADCADCKKAKTLKR